MDTLFSTACYIAAILFILWLRYTPSQPQASTQPTPTVEPMAENSETSETKPEAPAIADPWETPITPVAVIRSWVATKKEPIKPVLALCPAKEVKPAQVTKPEIDLNALDAVTLRKLCSSHKIQWRDVRGKNRHATKAMMITQLEAKAIA